MIICRNGEGQEVLRHVFFSFFLFHSQSSLLYFTVRTFPPGYSSRRAVDIGAGFTCLWKQFRTGNRSTGLFFGGGWVCFYGVQNGTVFLCGRDLVGYYVLT